MTIEEVRQAAIDLGVQFTAELRALEDSAGCKVHSVAVDQNPPKQGASQVTARVRMEVS